MMNGYDNVVLLNGIVIDLSYPLRWIVNMDHGCMWVNWGIFEGGLCGKRYVSDAMIG